MESVMMIDDLLDRYSSRFGTPFIRERPVVVTCPTCNKSGKVDVGEFMIDDAITGIASFPVVPGMVCEHAFMASIDKNYQSR